MSVRGDEQLQEQVVRYGLFSLSEIYNSRATRKQEARGTKREAQKPRKKKQKQHTKKSNKKYNKTRRKRRRPRHAQGGGKWEKMKWANASSMRRKLLKQKQSQFSRPASPTVPDVLFPLQLWFIDNSAMKSSQQYSIHFQVVKRKEKQSSTIFYHSLLCYSARDSSLELLNRILENNFEGKIPNSTVLLSLS